MRASHGPAYFRFDHSIAHCFPHGMESLRLLTRGTETVREGKISTSQQGRTPIFTTTDNRGDKIYFFPCRELYPGHFLFNEAKAIEAKLLNEIRGNDLILLKGRLGFAMEELKEETFLWIRLLSIRS